MADSKLDKPDLTPEQLAVVRHWGSPLVVRAGPGTGKTTVLAHRILFLLREKQIPKDQILAVTFTTKAAGEMTKKLSSLGLPEEEHPWIATLHAVSTRIVREHARVVDLPDDFLIAGRRDSDLILSDALSDTPQTAESTERSELKKRFNQSRFDGLVPSEITDDRLRAVRNHYGELLKFYRCLDFDGLILAALAILRMAPHVLEGYRKRADFFLIDEFQDINGAQHRLIRALVGQPDNLFAVGDPDQSIYSWRGGSPSFILEFAKHFPRGITRPLTHSHRCPGHILKGATAILGRDRSRDEGEVPQACGPDGEPIRMLVSKSENAEADWIAQWIRDVTSDGQYKAADISVLSADPSIADLTYGAVVEDGVAANRRRSSPLEATPSWRVLSLLRLAVNPDDNLAARICVTEGPVPGLGEIAARLIRSEARRTRRSILDVVTSPPKALSRWRQPLKKLAQYVQLLQQAAAVEAVPDLVERIVADLRLGEDGSAAYLLELAKQFASGSDAAGFLSTLHELRGLDATGELLGDQAEGVQFLSMHLAKGLESKVVFVLGLDDGLFPSPAKDLEEQRRLLYVAMTRAQKLLFLCTARMRKARGFDLRGPSPLLSEIPSQHMRRIANS